MWKDQPLTMEWCLGCHRNPERHLRPKEEVFNMAWVPPGGDQVAEGTRLAREYNILPPQKLTQCSICHR